MTVIEQLKELSQQATPGPWAMGIRKKDGSLWIGMGEFGKTRHSRSDFYGFEEDLRLIVTAIKALPELIAVAEAAGEWNKTKMILREGDVDTNAQAATDYYLASDKLSAALAKLEVEAVNGEGGAENA